jgi:thioredoxin-like negative regulator of GroEL
VKELLTIFRALTLEGTPMHHDSHIEYPCVKQETFDSLVLHAPLPVLVSFERAWSQPLLPPLEAVAAAFPGALRVVRVDCTAYPELAARYAIRIVPTLVLFQRRVPVTFLVGPVPAWGIVGTVAQALGARGLGVSDAGPRVPLAVPLTNVVPSSMQMGQSTRLLAGTTL